MKTVSKPGDNLGGLLKIWAVPCDVISLSGGTLTMSSTTNVYQLYCTAGSMDFIEEKESSEAGIVYNTVIKGFIPGNASDLLDAVEYIEPRKWAVVFRDGNGAFRIAGDATNILRVAAVMSTGKDTQELAGCAITFSGKTKNRAQTIADPF